MYELFVVTLFPELIEAFGQTGLLKRAQERGLVRITAVNPRQFTSDRHQTVDDTPYGGGSGMLLKPGPVVEAIEHACGQMQSPTPRRVLLTPQGQRLAQPLVQQLSRRDGLVLVCGRYEGIDERVARWVDEEVSIGDFVTLGGEVAAMALIEATARLRAEVLGNEQSPQDESHAQGLLEYPQYTRPAEFRGMDVPPVLQSGDHGAIARWRRQQSLARTWQRRPDLLGRVRLSDTDQRALTELEQAPEKDKS